MGACLQSGDICRLINGFVSVHKLCLTVNCGKLGELQKIGEYADIILCFNKNSTSHLNTYIQLQLGN